MSLNHRANKAEQQLKESRDELDKITKKLAETEQQLSAIKSQPQPLRRPLIQGTLS